MFWQFRSHMFGRNLFKFRESLRISFRFIFVLQNRKILRRRKPKRSFFTSFQSSLMRSFNCSLKVVKNELKSCLELQNSSVISRVLKTQKNSSGIKSFLEPKKPVVHHLSQFIFAFVIFSRFDLPTGESWTWSHFPIYEWIVSRPEVTENDIEHILFTSSPSGHLRSNLSSSFLSFVLSSSCMLFATVRSSLKFARVNFFLMNESISGRKLEVGSVYLNDHLNFAINSLMEAKTCLQEINDHGGNLNDSAPITLLSLLLHKLIFN